MRRLEQSEIERYASYPGAQPKIVQSILSAIGPDSATDLNELFSLARMQGWHRSTITAVLEGIAGAATPQRRAMKNPSSREGPPQTISTTVRYPKH